MANYDEQHTSAGSWLRTAITDASGHDAAHADGGHGGHLKLDYQPGLPLPNSKLIIWLFLSTEIMFFAALIGMYIVLRFGAPAWPMAHEVHLERADRGVQHVRADLLQRHDRAGAGSGPGQQGRAGEGARCW